MANLPSEFWLIEFKGERGTGSLVYDRTLLAFVPISVLSSGKVTQSEVMARFGYLDKDQVETQVKELQAMGAYAKSISYTLSKRVP